MPQHLIILYIVLPMFAGIAALLVGDRLRIRRTLGLGMLVTNVALAVWGVASVYQGPGMPTRVLSSQMGNWPAPFGITIALDGLSAIMLLTASIVVLAIFIYCITQLPTALETGMFHPMFHLLVFGVQWSFITGDLFNLFVAFEIMLMASYAMFIVGTSRQQMRQAYKYVLLNLISSMLFVTCCGWIYGQLGTLNMADLARISLSGQLPKEAVPVVAMLALVFGGKTSIFPLWFWLPETYPTMPPSIVALFSGLLTKVGAYVLARILIMVFGTSPHVQAVIFPVLLASAGVTMFVGVLGAVSMGSVRRILSIHIISQVGYMILGLGLATPWAIAGAIFFIMHNMIVKSCLFLCGGLMLRHAGSDELNKIGGLLRRAPLLATLFFIVAMSLAGLPPTSGFFGKWILVSETFHARRYVLVTIALATSLLTLLSMLKIWSYGFWSPPQGEHVDAPQRRPHTAGGIVAISILTTMAIVLGLGAQPVLNYCRGAAQNVVDPRAYISSVLGEQYAKDLPMPARLQKPADDRDQTRVSEVTP